MFDLITKVTSRTAKLAQRFTVRIVAKVYVRKIMKQTLLLVMINWPFCQKTVEASNSKQNVGPLSGSKQGCIDDYSHLVVTLVTSERGQ